MMSGDRSQRFIDIVHTLQPATLIDGRLGAEGDYRSMGDNKIPDEVLPGDWEVPATLNDTWGYKKDDNDWKSPEDLTFKLVDIVSKGGNYLLNVGPLKVNGEAVYGAGPTPFGYELGAADNTQKDKTGRPLFVVKTDWRCTTKPGKLYLTVFKWPEGSFELTKVNRKVKKAYLLAAAGRNGGQLTHDRP
jgi:alpha-L-fucosidase